LKIEVRKKIRVRVSKLAGLAGPSSLLVADASDTTTMYDEREENDERGNGAADVRDTTTMYDEREENDERGNGAADVRGVDGLFHNILLFWTLGFKVLCRSTAE
jgi:hypothetical protein